MPATPLLSSAALCLQLLLLAAAVQAQEACMGGESYDATSAAFPWDSVIIFNNADSQSFCSGTRALIARATPAPVTPTLWGTASLASEDSPNEITEATWAMLFTPPEVPYKYDSVCMRLVGKKRTLNSTASPTAPQDSPRAPIEVRGEVVIWEVTADRQSSKLRPDKERASYPFRASWPASVGKQPHWVTVNFLEQNHSMIAWEKGVYIGVRYWSCDEVGMTTMIDPSRPIRLVWNADNYLWTQSKYGDGVCNCDCGAWDIDCLYNQSSPDCKNSQICDQSGQCVCKHTCECEGISDPDCWDLYQNVSDIPL
eukprot:m51a1_g9752 hypothetical protein (312) ;mRNA; r:1599973-1601441